MKCCQAVQAWLFRHLNLHHLNRINLLTVYSEHGDSCTWATPSLKNLSVGYPFTPNFVPSSLFSVASTYKISQIHVLPKTLISLALHIITTTSTTLASLTGEPASARLAAAEAYSGANFLQWPHLGSWQLVIWCPRFSRSWNGDLFLRGTIWSQLMRNVRLIKYDVIFGWIFVSTRGRRTQRGPCCWHR